MRHIRVERDGTHTEEWAGRIVGNARRGFYQHGNKRWPETSKNITIRIVSEESERQQRAADEHAPWRNLR